MVSTQPDVLMLEQLQTTMHSHMPYWSHANASFAHSRTELLQLPRRTQWVQFCCCMSSVVCDALEDVQRSTNLLVQELGPQLQELHVAVRIAPLQWEVEPFLEALREAELGVELAEQVRHRTLVRLRGVLPPSKAWCTLVGGGGGAASGAGLAARRLCDSPRAQLLVLRWPTPQQLSREQQMSVLLAVTGMISPCYKCKLF